jgi:hypothetical protein
MPRSRSDPLDPQLGLRQCGRGEELNLTDAVSETFQVRLSAEERQRLAVRAAAVGMSRSESVRALTVAPVIPARLFNRDHERRRAFQLAELTARLEAIEAAAVAYLSQARAAAIVVRLDAIRAQLDRLMPGPAEADQP